MNWKRQLWMLCVLTLSGSIAFGFWWPDSIAFILLSTGIDRFQAVIFFSLATAALLGLISICFRKRTTFAAISRIVALAALLQMAGSYGVGRVVISMRLHDAQRFAESFIPELESVRRTTGKYPDDIKAQAALRDLATVPRYLSGVNHQFYWSDGVRFRFWFVDPGNCRLSYQWESNRRIWEADDSYWCPVF